MSELSEIKRVLMEGIRRHDTPALMGLIAFAEGVLARDPETMRHLAMVGQIDTMRREVMELQLACYRAELKRREGGPEWDLSEGVVN